MSSEFFPLEIIREILLKLPAESLLRCKSVCKEWYSLISEQDFIKTHYTLSSTNVNYEHHRLIYIPFGHMNNLKVCPLYDVLFDKSVSNAFLLENPLQRPPPRKVRLIGSCNGLLCILVEDDNTMFIYNPCTRAIIKFPGFKQGGFSMSVSYGFGYDEKTHDYKVVRIGLRDLTSWDHCTMIYSLKAKSWKEIGDFPRASILAKGKFLNGALYWLTSCYLSGLCHIVSLDLEKETYGEILLPEYDKGFKRLTFGGWEEWFCVLCNSYGTSCVGDFRVMKVYGAKESWTKLACIPHRTNPWNYFLVPLCISKDGKVLLRYGPKLLVYDSKDSSSSEIDNFDLIHKACIVVESLVSPYTPC